MLTKIMTIPLALVAVLNWNAHAQDNPQKNRLVTTLAHAYTSTGGFDDAGGEFSVNTSSLKVKIDVFTMKYDLQHFDWNDTGALPIGAGDAPWTDLHSFETSVTLTRPANKDWMLRYQFGLGTAFESETDDSFSLRGGVLAMRKWDDFNLIVGVIGEAHQQIDPILLPMLGLSWRQGKTGWSAGLGFPVTEVRYGFSEDFSVALGGLFDLGEVARLADDSNVAPAGYMRLEGGGVELSAKWKALDWLDLRMGVASIGCRKLTIFDDDGDEVDDYDLDDAWCARLSLTMRL